MAEEAKAAKRGWIEQYPTTIALIIAVLGWVASYIYFSATTAEKLNTHTNELSSISAAVNGEKGLAAINTQLAHITETLNADPRLRDTVIQLKTNMDRVLPLAVNEEFETKVRDLESRLSTMQTELAVLQERVRSRDAAREVTKASISVFADEASQLKSAANDTITVFSDKVVGLTPVEQERFLSRLRELSQRAESLSKMAQGIWTQASAEGAMPNK